MVDHNQNRQPHIIIVGAGELTMPAYQIAREDLDLGIIAFDYNAQSPGMLYADYSIEVSTKDILAAVDSAKKLSEELDIVGVFTCGADVEVTVAAIAEALSLPGVSLEVARCCNDKVQMHQYLDSRGFEGKAKYRLVNSLSEARNAASEIGFPCIIKPIDNCASRGVQRLDSLEEFDDAYALAISFNLHEQSSILIEECLVGTKHTVEMIAYQDQWHLLSIVDTHYISPRWPCETGLNTTTLSTDMQQKAFAFAEQVSRLIGIDINAHKVDINIAADGQIKVIELTARLSGGYHCQYASPLAFGSNDIRAALKLSVGQSLDESDIRHKYEQGAAVQAIFPQPGRITSISGTEDALAISGVEHVFITRNIGDQVGPYQNSGERVAFVIAQGETAIDAIAKAKQGASQISIDTDGTKVK